MKLDMIVLDPNTNKRSVFDFWRDLGGHPNTLVPQVEIQKSKTERLFVFGSSIIVSSFMKIRFELTKPQAFFTLGAHLRRHFGRPRPPRGRIAKTPPDHCSTVYSKGIDTSHDYAIMHAIPNHRRIFNRRTDSEMTLQWRLTTMFDYFSFLGVSLLAHPFY